MHLVGCTMGMYYDAQTNEYKIWLVTLKRERKTTGCCKEMLQHEFHSQYFAGNVIRMKTLRKLRLVGLAVRVGEKTNSYKI